MTWIYGIARHKLLDHYRRAQRAERQVTLDRASEAAGEELVVPDTADARGQPADRGGPPAAVREAGSLDLARERIGTIIWATGYAYDLGWVKAPVLDTAGRPVQQRGVTQAPGLYFLGLHWMHTIKSGLLTGVGNDAEYLAEHTTQTPAFADGGHNKPPGAAP